MLPNIFHSTEARSNELNMADFNLYVCVYVCVCVCVCARAWLYERKIEEDKTDSTNVMTGF